MGIFSLVFGYRFFVSIYIFEFSEGYELYDVTECGFVFWGA